MTTPELFALIEEALEVPSGTIAANTMIADVKEWDSLSWLTIMALLDERADVMLTWEEIDSVKKVSDLETILRSRSVVA